MDIKPIETEYKGYKFRSRLEARWAVFFDALGVEWDYEKEGYILPDGTYYLPDFWVKAKDGETYIIECKGDRSDSEGIRKANMLDDNLPICADGCTIAVCVCLAFEPPTIPTEAEFCQGADPYCEVNDYSAGETTAYIASIRLGFYDYDVVCEAAKAARQARFEHGEKGGLI